MEKIKVVLADDHQVVRQGLRALLDAEADIAVVGEAETGRHAVQLTKQLRPHVVVMDIAMPMLNGLEATRQILQDAPGTKVLILSTYSDDEYVLRVTEAGASGYLIKQIASSDLLQAIRQVRNGRSFYCSTISKRLLQHFSKEIASGKVVRARPNPLTRREAEVLQLIAEGWPNKGIASELSISIKTVEKHRQQVMNKLNIHDVAGLTRYAINQGMLENHAGRPRT